MAGVDVTINGAPQWNTSDYSVQEDATSLDPSSSSGGSPMFSLGTNQLSNDKRLIGQPITISDGAQGRVQGKITGLDGANGFKLNITGYTSVNLLNTIVSSAPYSGTLAGAIAYLLGLVGLTSSSYQVDTTIGTRSVSLRGFNANLQDKLKELCSGRQIEMSYVDNQLVFRSPRQNVAQVYRDSQVNWALSMDAQAQSISCFYYNAAAITNGLVYPVTQPDTGSEIQQVSDGQTITVNLRLDPNSPDGTGYGVSPASINQPICVSSIPEAINAYASGFSSYTVLDSSNNPVSALVWNNGGGSITVAIDPDSNGLTLTITAPSLNIGPYRIAATADAGSTFYSSIRILGSGVKYNKKLYTVATGLTSLDTNTVSPPTVDNFAINTYGDAVSAMLSALRNYQGPSQQITVTTHGINTSGKSGEYTLITFGGWDALFGGTTFATWDASWGGKTLAQYDAYLFSLVRGQFANQAFGNVAGSRVFNDSSFFRIVSATITEGGVSYTAIADNLFQDWDNVWAGKTFAQWDSAWGGSRFLDYTPTLLSTGTPTVTPSYLPAAAHQDVSNSPGLGFEYFPNLQQWHR